MNDFVINIEKATIRNDNYRKIVKTSEHMQLSLMSIKQGNDIGDEVHPFTDQFFRIEKGIGVLHIHNKNNSFEKFYKIRDGDSFIIPAGLYHNVYSTHGTLKLYSIYSPPHHLPNTVHHTKLDADEDVEDQEYGELIQRSATL